MKFRTSVKSSTRLSEKFIEKALFLFTILTVITTIAIVLSLFGEAFSFFSKVSLIEFFTGTQWTPTLKPRHFGVLPLIVGTGLITIISGFIALPFGLGSAIYLSEFAPKKMRHFLKPALEILAGIPSIVYGFFALSFITPLLRTVFPETEIFNALSAGIAVGIMTLPMVASLSEDAMNAVPDSLRHGAYALGATKMEIATKVVVPASLSSICASFVLALSRAIGETMIVSIAAGQSPILTLNPLKSIQTMTGFMVNLSLGDIQQGTIEFQTLYAVGALLFIITLLMNYISRMIVRTFSDVY